MRLKTAREGNGRSGIGSVEEARASHICGAPLRPSEPVPVKKRRQSRYGEQLTRAWAFLREKASTEPEVSALDQEYERQIVEGPRYHRGSEFIDVPRINCDRNFLAKVLFIARAIERGSYKVRAKGKHGGTLGRSALAVLELLINMAQARQGRVAPGYEALAAIARLSRQTVITRDQRARAHGARNRDPADQAGTQGARLQDGAGDQCFRHSPSGPRRQAEVRCSARSPGVWRYAQPWRPRGGDVREIIIRVKKLFCS